MSPGEDMIVVLLPRPHVGEEVEIRPDGEWWTVLWISGDGQSSQQWQIHELPDWLPTDAELALTVIRVLGPLSRRQLAILRGCLS